MRFPRLLVVSLLCLPLLAASAEEVTDVVFVGGQSNAKPQLAAGVEAALRADGRFENLRVLNKRHGGTPIRFWLDEDLPRDHRRHPAQQGLDAPNWYEVDFAKADGRPGPSGFLETVFAEESAAGRRPRLAGVVWFQGESDSADDAQVAAYRGLIEGLRARIARDFHRGDPVPTVLVQVAVDDAFVPTTFGPADPQRVTRIDALRGIQAALARDEPTIAVIDSKPFGRVDVWHVDWESPPVAPLQKLGEACGEALLGLGTP